MMNNMDDGWHWGFGFGHWGFGILIWLAIIFALFLLFKILIKK